MLLPHCFRRLLQRDDCIKSVRKPYYGATYMCFSRSIYIRKYFSVLRFEISYTHTIGRAESWGYGERKK